MMNRRNKTLLGIGSGCLLACGIAVGIWNFDDDEASVYHTRNQSKPGAGQLLSGGKNSVTAVKQDNGVGAIQGSTSQGPEVISDSTIAMADRTYIRPIPPMGMADFLAMRKSEQLKKCETLTKDYELPSDVLAYLRAALHDRELSEAVRHLMMVALDNQTTKDPYLYLDILDIIDDPTQSERWRMYGVQYLSSVYPYAAESERVMEKLRTLSETDNTLLGAQAITMLGYMHQRGDWQPDEAYRERLGQCLDNPVASDELRISALGIVGSSQLDEHHDSVRTLAEQPSTYQRVAIATLGSIGREDDRKLLTELSESEDKYLAFSAKTALDRLNRRQAGENMSNPGDWAFDDYKDQTGWRN